MSLKPDYKKLPVSLIATVLNEAQTIEQFLQSYLHQTIHASEFIVIDAGSSDGTVALLQNFARRHPTLQLRISQQVGSKRGAARNLAIKTSAYPTIVMTDAGCRLDPHWLEQLWLVKNQQQAQVVGGFFAGDARSRIEQAIVPYFLQLGTQVTPDTFVPTSRSLLIDKEVFWRSGGFREDLVVSEDYELMRRLQQLPIRFAFAKQALVYWQPPSNLAAFARKIVTFAYSDAHIGILRKKVTLIYLRYTFFALLWQWHLGMLLVVVALYIWWSIWKNYRVASKAWYYLPVLQISSDLLIMGATALGLFSWLQNTLGKHRLTH